MFTKTLFQTLFDYHWHTYYHLLDLAAQLDEADYKEQTGYGKGSMHDIFFHLIRALNNWRQGMETGKRLYSLTPRITKHLWRYELVFRKNSPPGKASWIT